MPDVGLFTATDPLPKNAKVVIKYTIEVEGLPVYTETYDAAKIVEELEKDEGRALDLWSRRIRAVACCRHKERFSACLTSYLADGLCDGDKHG
jgi:hypothetical protein